MKLDPWVTQISLSKTAKLIKKLNLETQTLDFRLIKLLKIQRVNILNEF